MVTVTEDLMAQSRELAQIGWELSQEARTWTVPEARPLMEDAAMQCRGWAQAAALASTRGDYWSRLDALFRAEAQTAAARLILRRWWQAGESWNSHRVRPVPASIGSLTDG